jgi:NAD(P)-dependent dehydrogenase (short-subunit alcohol dehydrogenase family)
MSVAVVSGASSGIGLAVAQRLRADGFVVAGCAEDGDGQDVARVDVTDESQVSAFVERTASVHGRIVALCNAAGVKATGTALETDLATWNRTLGVNVTGAFLLTKAVLPNMLAHRGGSIVNIGSPAGYGGDGQVAYATSKGALLARGASLAIDLLPDGIRVNTVVPSTTRTPMTAGRPPEIERAVARMNVAGRINEPDDVASAVSFLLSDRAATISGAVLEVGWVSGQVVHAIDPGGAS